MTELAVLNHAEQVALEECERVIGGGLKSFIETGSALSFVRDNRLYRSTHSTFEAYCRERWNLTPQHANRLALAAGVVMSLEPTGSIPPPKTERQARELAKVPEPERAEVWKETVERTNGKPTAEAVKAVRKERVTPPTAEVVSAIADKDAPTTDPVADVKAALDKYVPDPDAPARAWRGNFHTLLKAPHDFLVRCDADQIAEHADDQDVETLRLLADSYAALYRRVLAKRGSNITPLRRVK